MQEELKRLDDNFRMKLQHMDSVSKEIRKENLTGLTIENSGIFVGAGGQVGLASGATKLLLSTSTLPNGGTQSRTVQGLYNRIGSTRKMVGYPRELESAVATNKNPNGVWV